MAQGIKRWENNGEKEKHPTRSKNSDRFEAAKKSRKGLQNIARGAFPLKKSHPVLFSTKKEIFEFIEENRENYSLLLMCRVYSVTVDGYRSWKRRGKSKRTQDDELLFGRILHIFNQYDQIYGSPKIHKELRKEGIYVGVKRVARIMRAHGLRAIKARLYRTKKAQPNSAFRNNISFELLDKIVTGINQVWRGDITYLKLNGKWKYLATILDHYSRRIIAWGLSDNRDAGLTIRTLERAVRNRGHHQGLIFHTDQGIEYAAFSYQKRLSNYGFIQSMNRSETLNDNAEMESFYHQFKTEKVRKKEYTSEKTLKGEVTGYMNFYNYRRSHSSLGYISPVEYETLHA